MNCKPDTASLDWADVVPLRAPRVAFCWWCKRATDTTRRVDTEDGTEAVCDECWEDVSPPVALDWKGETDAR